MDRDGAGSLFEAALRGEGPRSSVPLAERMRPRSLQELVGQKRLFGEGTALFRMITTDSLRSLLLWGPPGVGKTTLGRVIAETTRAHFVPFSAVLGSVAEVRKIVEEAKSRRRYRGERTILFVDEIHRFNKGQQDAFLPHVEDGTLTLIGATTENPSFCVNAALLSRCTLLRLSPLEPSDIGVLLTRALADLERGLGPLGLEVDPEVLRHIARASAGDARRAYGMLEGLAAFATSQGQKTIELEILKRFDPGVALRHDRAGEDHYNVVSAFIKSMRGSDPDASVYWMMRLLDAGEDPRFLLRRMVIFASEDVGNADPRALLLVTAADQAFARLGMPEGIYPIAHAVTYLACTPKSNAVKLAWQRARALVEEHGALEVPMRLRNAPTPMMVQEGYGEAYRYPHDEPGGVARGEAYLPERLSGQRLYEPTDRGEESRIRARLESLRERKHRE